MEAFWKAIIEFFTTWYRKLTGSNPPKTETPVEVPEVVAPVDVERKILRLTYTNAKDSRGLAVFRLSLTQEKDLRELDHVFVVSGARGSQALRTAGVSQAGSMEPIPEGYYVLGPIEWAEARDKWNGKVWSSALGPVWIAINPAPGMKTGRSALGFHVDWNEDGAPGSAGCVVFPRNLVAIKKFLTWFDDPRTAPKKMTVNYGFGSVETKPSLPSTPSTGWKVMLEVGHGPYRERTGKLGFEEGANGVGTTEYQENKWRASRIEWILKNSGVSVVVNDQQDTLEALGAMAAGNHVMVSLHLNAFDKRVQGCETLIHRDGTSEDAELAECIQKRCVELLKINDRGVKRQGLAVLGSVPASVKAACLSEAFFIDALQNASEIRAMSEISARAIVQGILDYTSKNSIS